MGKLSNIGVTILLAGLIAVGFSNFYADLYTTYNPGAAANTTAFLNKSLELQKNITAVKGVIQNSQVTGTIADVFIVAANGLLEGLKLIFSFADILGSMISDIGSFLFIPGWILVVFGSIASLVILFLIMSSLNKYDI